MLNLFLPSTDYIAPIRVMTNGIRACTHLAQIGGSLDTGYVKAFPSHSGNALFEKALFNELAGGLLAQHAGIGSPKGGLIWVNLSILEELFPLQHFNATNQAVLCYVSTPVNNGYGLASAGLADAMGKVLEEIRKQLLAWPGFPACVAFDEWIGNVDRHSNNVLLQAGVNLVPIDHSDCFGGPDWQPLDFVTKRADWYTNRLLEDYFDPVALPLPVKTSLMQAADRFSNICKQTRSDLEGLRSLLDEPTGLNWLDWVSTRAENTAHLLRDRVRLIV